MFDVARGSAHNLVHTPKKKVMELALLIRPEATVTRRT